MLKGEIESITSVQQHGKDNLAPLKLTSEHSSCPICHPRTKSSVWAASMAPAMGGFEAQALAPRNQAFDHGLQELRRESHDFKRKNPRRVRST